MTLDNMTQTSKLRSTPNSLTEFRCLACNVKNKPLTSLWGSLLGQGGGVEAAFLLYHSGIFQFQNQLEKTDFETVFWWKLLFVIQSPQNVPYIFSRCENWVEKICWVSMEMVPINFFFRFLRKIPWFSNSVTSWQSRGSCEHRPSETLIFSVEI